MTNDITIAPGKGRPYCDPSWWGGASSSGTWYSGRSSFDWDAGHEAGHLMGLPDHYTDVGLPAVSVPNKDWRGDIMAEIGGVASGRDVHEIVR
jgi:hypothetical protein